MDREQYTIVQMIIIANRINSQGKALNDSYISQRAQNSAELIAKKHEYTTAQEVSLNKEVRIKDLKQEVNISFFHRFVRYNSIASSTTSFIFIPFFIA